MRAVQRRIRRFARACLRFRLHRRGNVAITFALAVIPILGFIGAAIDYSRANAMKVDLQAALDATALMVSKNASSLTQDQLTSTARAYFLSLFHDPQAQNTNFTITYSTTGGSNVVVGGTADMKTEFISIIGFNTITIGGTATARWGSTRLRVALVLDTTGSMGSDGKIAALKTATKNLLKQLKDAASTDGDVYVSIIPFSKDVSVGANNYTSWNASIDWSQDWTNVAPTASTGNSAPSSSVGPGSSCPYSSRNDGYSCVTQPGGTTQTNTVPSSGSNKGNICPSNSFGCYDSVAQTTVVGSGWYASCWGYSNCSCSGYGYGKVCSITGYSHTWFVDKSKWKGCISDRGDSGAPSAQDYDRNVTAPTSGVSASLFPAEQYGYCPSPMMGLTYNWTTMNSVVDEMTPNGSTNQPIGLVWGWQSLVGGGPFTAPAMESIYTYKQTIILLSDGLNTQDRWYGDGSHTSTDVDKRMYDSSNNGAGTCANIKAAGIEIYAIQVNTGNDPTSTLLQHCASSSDKFFLLTSADQIITTFQKIGTSLSQLRIAK